MQIDYYFDIYSDSYIIDSGVVSNIYGYIVLINTINIAFKYPCITDNKKLYFKMASQQVKLEEAFIYLHDIFPDLDTTITEYIEGFYIYLTMFLEI